MSGAFSFGGGGSSSISEQNFNFQYQATTYYPIHVVSYRLQKSYFVGEQTAYYLRSDGTLKKKVIILIIMLNLIVG